MEKYKLSPCVSSAVTALPENVSAWEFAKHLFEMHPEYTQNKIKAYFNSIDEAYQGQKQPIHTYLEVIAKKFPDSELLYTQLVMLGLYQIDKELNQLIPEQIMRDMENSLN